MTQPMSSIDGLISGLNTTELIEQLMQAERVPQLRLETKKSGVDKDVAAYQSINSKIASLESAVSALSEAADWGVFSATSSDTTAVTAEAGSSALAGSLSFKVTKLAQAHALRSSWTATSLSDVVAGGTIQITKGTGTPQNVDVGTNASLSTVVSAINQADIGVTAAAVQVASGQYRLQLTSSTTGADSTLSLSGGFNPGYDTFVTLAAAQDAELTVGDPLNGGYTVTSASNDVTGVLPGVTFHLLDTTTTNVTVNVTPDSSALADKVSRVVDTLNAALSEIKTLSSYDTATKKAGTLLGDSVTRRLQSQLADAVTAAVTGSSLGSAGLAGITLQRDGTFGFDRTKFTDAYASDPTAVRKLFTNNEGDGDGVAERLLAVADGATDIVSGSLTVAINGNKTLSKSIDDQIAKWEERLADKELALRRQFTTLETALSELRNQGSWLTSQLASLQ